MILHRTAGTLALNDYFMRLYGSSKNTGVSQFRHLCDAIEKNVMRELEEEHANKDYGTSAQHDALLGKPDSVRYFYSKIASYLKERNVGNVEYPSCFRNLIEAVFHEVWGYSVLAEWFQLKDSQSAKVIGDNIYYLKGGRAVLQPYKLPEQRREQLKNKLLLNTPEKSRNSPYVEMNLVTGERITIYNNRMTKQGRDTIVFRNYTVNNYTWEEQVKLGTIHAASLALMKKFCKVGYNVIFAGPRRAGKTTMLETWQSYEDPTLEGITLEETDEIKFDQIMPGSPITQLIVGSDDIGDVIKPVLRSDADYVIDAEGRSGYEYDVIVRLANKGTNRCKTTIHTTHPEELIHDIADEIMAVRPNADYNGTMMKVGKAYHYVIQLAQLYRDKSHKRVTGIYEICADRTKNTIEMYRICEYDFERDTWRWAFHIGDDKREIALRESFEDFKSFEKELQSLATKFPMQKESRLVVYEGGRR